MSKLKTELSYIVRCGHCNKDETFTLRASNVNFDRLRLVFKVLFSPRIIVVTRGEQFCTFNNANIMQDSKRIVIEVAL